MYKALLFDTSTWINLIKDTNKGNNIISKLYKNNIIPLLTIYNVVELVNTNQKPERLKRINFISTLNKIYIISKNNSIGSIEDVRYFEYLYYLSNMNIKLEDYITKCLKIVDGMSIKNAIGTYNNNYQNIISSLNKKNFLLSIPWNLLYDDIDPKKTKLRDLKLRSKISNDLFNKHSEKINNIIKNKGDKKRTNHEKVEAFDFFINMMKEKIFEVNNPTIIDLFSILSGIEIKYFNLDATIQDTIFFIEYYKELEIFSLENTLNLNDLLNINQKNILSWQLEKSFKISYENILLKDQRRLSEASSIYDKNLAAYSPYFYVIVDKRTKEILNVVKKENVVLKNIKYLFINNIEDLNEINRMTICQKS